MRVIAGTAKGARLGRVPAGVRPVSDRAREGLFSSLGAAVSAAAVLDLFAGTGGLGIEALSRGAETAVFVERNPAAVRALRDNLGRTRLAERSEVVRADVLTYLAQPQGGRFDLVLADPPYGAPAAQVDGVLEAVAAGRLREGATVALTRRSASSMPVIPVSLLVARRLEYGDTSVLILREA
jgi:16S rRNA (guanine966-N2)-methyltransferase